MNKIFLLLFLIVSLNSCGGYVSSMYKELDNSEKVKRRRRGKMPSELSIFRRKNLLKSKQGISTNGHRQYAPPVKRNYSGRKTNSRRTTTSDLNDNNNSASLWSGERGNNQFLFTLNKEKRYGDIVLINVLESLKKEIQVELQRAFPKRRPPTKDKAGKDAGKEGETTPKEEVASTEPEANDSEGNGNFHDRISSIVIEEINADHLLVRGRKHILYQKRKRLVEVQALLSRRDIQDDDTINSNNLIESTVTIIR